MTRPPALPIVIELPAPPRALRPNAQSPGNWWVKAKAVKRYRQAAALIAMGGPRPGWTSARIQITLRLGKGCRQQDPDNVLASMKSGIDGLVDAGVLAGDRHVIYMPVVQVRDPANPGVKVEVFHAK